MTFHARDRSGDDAARRRTGFPPDVCRAQGLRIFTNSGELHSVASARFHVGQVPVDPVTLSGAIDRICDLAATGRGGTVYTPNVDHVVVADRHVAFRAAYSEVSLSLVDGTPVLWAGRLLGFKPPEKVSGSDLFEPLVAETARLGLPIFLLGGGPGVAELARSALVGRYPALRVVGLSSPRVDASGKAENEAEVLEVLRAAAPAIVFVACGAPKSELFSHRVKSELPSSVFVCVGAAIDFAAGTARRAPRWLSRVGLEWAYRLMKEPRRLAARYLLRDPKFFWILGRQLLARTPALLGRGAPVPAPPLLEVVPGSHLGEVSRAGAGLAAVPVSGVVSRVAEVEPVAVSGVIGEDALQDDALRR